MPKKLQLGDTIGVVAPAGPLANVQLLEEASAFLTETGFVVKEGLFVRKKSGFLAGDDAERLYDLHMMFSDDTVKAIFCLRGGYGSMRLLEGLDVGLIKAHPKIFLGYSDITALHLYLSQTAELVTFHGPMAATDMHKGFSSFSREGLFSVLTEPDYNKVLWRNPPEKTIKVLYPGDAAAPLTGGNLTLVASSLGTPFEIETKGKILFLEDVHVEAYEIDRMLAQLKLAGKFEYCAGFLLGDFGADGTKEDMLEQLFLEWFSSYQKPLWIGASFGHIRRQWTLPMGVPVYMQSGKKEITLLKPCVE